MPVTPTLDPERPRAALVHVVSPYLAAPDGGQFAPLDWVQWSMLASARAAREHYAEHVETRRSQAPAFADVFLVCVVSVAEMESLRSTLENYCSHIAPYHRNTATEFPFLSKGLPFVQDIFDAGIDFARDRGLAGEDGYFFMMTNSDICLTETFFGEVEGIISKNKVGALTINRKTIRKYEVITPMGNWFEAKHTAALELARHGQTMVEQRIFSRHDGVDCFVMRSPIAEGLNLGKQFLGFPPWDWNLREVVEILDGSRANKGLGSVRFQSHGTKGGTYHFGDDMSWRNRQVGNNKSPRKELLEFMNEFRGESLAFLPWCPIVGPPGNRGTLQNAIECGKLFLHKSKEISAPMIAASPEMESAWLNNAKITYLPMGMQQSPVGPSYEDKMRWLRTYPTRVEIDFDIPTKIPPDVDVSLQRILYRETEGIVRKVDDMHCDLPPCELVRRSRLFSPRCAENDRENDMSGDSPLLIASSPDPVQLGIVRAVLNGRGLDLQVDPRSSPAFRSGLTSWMYDGEEDLKRHRRFRTVLHQVSEPLSGITALCNEPLLSVQKEFWQRHVPFASSRVREPDKATSCLELWVEW